MVKLNLLHYSLNLFVGTCLKYSLLCMELKFNFCQISQKHFIQEMEAWPETLIL
jgi:hypothetical protein